MARDKTNNSSVVEMNQLEKKCGIIMPIANCDGYPTSHWNDVKQIITEAVNETEFKPNLVSDDVAIGLIHERIVTNIYNSDIVICDVSSKNPNVMFELGLRLAFDKPTIIIKDEKTGYTFDAGVIEHLNYPSSLRFSEIVKFKNDLKNSIENTYAKSIKSDASSFLKSFGRTIVPAEVGELKVSESRYIQEQLEIIRNEIRQLGNNNRYLRFKGLDIDEMMSDYLRNRKKDTVGGIDIREIIEYFALKGVNVSESDILDRLGRDHNLVRHVTSK